MARGRPKFEPTDEHRKLVTALYGYGLPADQVRQHIINPSTGKPITRTVLFRVFRAELDAGMAIANAKILQTAFNIAVNPKHPKGAAMNMFWQKTRMGFKEVQPPDADKPVPKSIPVKIKEASVADPDASTG